jgi:hypothetical protein
LVDPEAPDLSEFIPDATHLIRGLFRIFDETTKIKALDKVDKYHCADLIYALCCVYRLIMYYSNFFYVCGFMFFVRPNPDIRVAKFKQLCDCMMSFAVDCAAIAQVCKCAVLLDVMSAEWRCANI